MARSVGLPAPRAVTYGKFPSRTGSTSMRFIYGQPLHDVINTPSNTPSAFYNDAILTHAQLNGYNILRLVTNGGVFSIVCWEHSE